MAIKDLRKCRRADNGKLYCFDSDLKEWVEVILKVTKPHDLPDDFIKSLGEDGIQQEQS